MKSLTLLAWVRVESLPNVQNSLLMGESFKPGEVHWYLYRDGALGLGVRSAEGKPGAWQLSHSRPVAKPETFGSWVFLASTFDGATGTVSHYFNGQPVGAERSGIRGLLRPGTFEIGNWGVRANAPEWSWAPVRGPYDYVRNFHGPMDEFAILSNPLSAEEIRQLYERGRADQP
jgi:Concanavalin A-like lectin/glucanases superfamily